MIGRENGRRLHLLVCCLILGTGHQRDYAQLAGRKIGHATAYYRSQLRYG
jgi:hypothetical protein